MTESSWATPMFANGNSTAMLRSLEICVV